MAAMFTDGYKACFLESESISLTGFFDVIDGPFLGAALRNTVGEARVCDDGVALVAGINDDLAYAALLSE
jgi:hypothetical protein